MRNRRNRRRIRKLVTAALFLLVGGLAIFSLITRFTNKNSAVLSVNNQSLRGLEQVVSTTLEGTKGSYGLIVKNLKTGESYSFNEKDQFLSGSLYKLWVMATVFGEIEKGSLSEDEILSGDVFSLNDKFNISADVADLTEGTISARVTDALKQMITISHNYDALLLTERVKLSTVKSFLDQSDFKDSKVGVDGAAPTTTASDIALFLEKLRDKKLANEENTNKMLDLLKQQQLNDKLPKYLPKGVTIAHKTGELDSYSHDAGIVYASFGDYIIVVLSDSDLSDAANERIANMSKNVYQYFLEENNGG